MTAESNTGARAATARAITRWMLVHGTHPDNRAVIMLSIVEQATGRPIASGFGESELTACNALLADLTERCRGLLGIRRMAKTWREQLRLEAGEIRAAKSAAFLGSCNAGTGGFLAPAHATYFAPAHLAETPALESRELAANPPFGA